MGNRTKRMARAAVGLALLLAVAASDAAPPVDRRAEHGEKLAQSICSACHVVAKVQEFMPLLDPPAASFFDIANRPDTTLKSLQHFVKTTHWDEKTLPVKMPDPELSESEIVDVAHYILSLRTTP